MELWDFRYYYNKVKRLAPSLLLEKKITLWSLKVPTNYAHHLLGNTPSFLLSALGRAELLLGTKKNH